MVAAAVPDQPGGMAEILEKRYEEDGAVLVLRASGPNAERIREMLSGEDPPCAS